MSVNYRQIWIPKIIKGNILAFKTDKNKLVINLRKDIFN